MKKILVAIFLVSTLAIAIGLYFFNLKPKDIRTEDALFEITANQLVKEFSDDESMADKKYVDKVIIVNGIISDIKITDKESSMSLQSDDPMAGVTCSFYTDEAKNLKGLTIGNPVKVKGKCTGKLMDVVLNNCSLVK